VFPNVHLAVKPFKSIKSVCPSIAWTPLKACLRIFYVAIFRLLEKEDKKKKKKKTPNKLQIGNGIYK
jgi:hypothetical protein